MPTVTEYAVRHTAWRHGQAKVVVTETHLPTDRGEATYRVEAIRAEQSDHRALPVDAEIVTRTVTVTGWTPGATPKENVVTATLDYDPTPGRATLALVQSADGTQGRIMGPDNIVAGPWLPYEEALNDWGEVRRMLELMGATPLIRSPSA